MPYGLGIDLGTSRTVAAISRADTGLNVVPLGGDAPGVPTVLHLADDGTLLVGEATEPPVLSDPNRVFRNFLHRIGEPAPVAEPHPPPLRYRPEALTARLVRWVVDSVAEREGELAQQITLAHPAVWGAHECHALTDALSSLGLPGVMFVPAPAAAAMVAPPFAPDGGPAGDTVAVYDLGATFSASIVRQQNAGFTILGAPRLLGDGGGTRFDEMVLAQVLNEVEAQMTAVNLTDQATLASMSRLLAHCAAAREALSHQPDVTIPVSLPGVSAWVRLTSTDLETLIEPTLRLTVAALRAAISAAALTPADIGSVLVVGGCARNAQVARVLDTELGRPTVVLAHPELAMAQGAALLSAQPQPAEPHSAAQLHSFTPPPPALLHSAAPAHSPAPARSAEAQSSTQQPHTAAGQPDLAAGFTTPMQAFQAEPTERLALDPASVEDTVRLAPVASLPPASSPADSPYPSVAPPAPPPVSAPRGRPRRRPRMPLIGAAGILAVTTLILPVTLLGSTDPGAEHSTTSEHKPRREPANPGHQNRAPAYGGAVAPTETTTSITLSPPVAPPPTQPGVPTRAQPAPPPRATPRGGTGPAVPAPGPVTTRPPIITPPPPITTRPPTPTVTTPPSSNTTTTPSATTTPPPTTTSFSEIPDF